MQCYRDADHRLQNNCPPSGLSQAILVDDREVIAVLINLKLYLRGSADLREPQGELRGSSQVSRLYIRLTQ